MIEIGLAAALLGRRVRGGRVEELLLRGVLGGPHLPREAEVAKLGGAFRGDEDVLGLDVAVDEAVLERVAETARDLPGDVERPFLRQPSRLVDLLEERLAGDVLHDEVIAAVGLAAVEGADDVLVGDLRGGARFLEEVLDIRPIFREVRRKELDRDEPVEAFLPRQVDVAHAARAQPPLETESGDVDRQVGRRRHASEAARGFGMGGAGGRVRSLGRSVLLCGRERLLARGTGDFPRAGGGRGLEGMAARASHRRGPLIHSRLLCRWIDSGKPLRRRPAPRPLTYSYVSPAPVGVTSIMY